MAGRTELPSLYHTRTILRRTRRIRLISSRFISTQQKSENDVDDKAPIWSPLAGKPATKDTRSGTTISSTITASERRAFETVLRFAPKFDEPRPVKRPSPHQDAIDTDVDNILKIFTSAVRDHELKRVAALGSRRVVVRREAELERLKNQASQERVKILSSSPAPPKARTFYRVESPAEQGGNFKLDQRGGRARDEVQYAEQRNAEPAQQPAVEAESNANHPEPQQQIQPANELNQVESQDLPSEVLERESGDVPSGLSSEFATELTTHPQPMPDMDIEHADETLVDTADTIIVNEGFDSTNLQQTVLPTTDSVDATLNEALDAGRVKTEHAENVDHADSLEEGLPEATLHEQEMIQLDDPIQSAVRTKLHAISASLEAAASSEDDRGDIAMWEVVESEIFSIAKHFQPQTTPIHTTAPFAGIRQFTFSKEKSDRPRQMIEVAEREQRVTPASTPATTRPTRSPSKQSLEPISQQSLQILQNVYPAALLLALRLYITHFPTSAYPFLLLPTIRSLGTTSYVLGASPQFYTSLLSLIWMVRGSLREVDNLLGEMERGGVEMDEGTYAVLGAIEDERIADLEREKKGDETSTEEVRVTRGAAWWKRQEQMLFFPRILDWLDVIAGRLAAKERESLSAD